MRALLVSAVSVLALGAAHAQSNTFSDVETACKGSESQCVAAVGTFVEASIFNRNSRAEKVIVELAKGLCDGEYSVPNYQAAVIEAISSMRSSLAATAISIGGATCDAAEDAVQQAASQAVSASGQTVKYVPSPS